MNTHETWLNGSRPTSTPTDDDPRGRDQQPETDAWPGWAPGTVREGADHTTHRGTDRERSKTKGRVA